MFAQSIKMIQYEMTEVTSQLDSVKTSSSYQINTLSAPLTKTMKRCIIILIWETEKPSFW